MTDVETSAEISASTTARAGCRWRDWLGGLPSEVASGSQVVEFYEQREFELVRLVEGTGSVRNHEYVFRRITGGKRGSVSGS